MRNYPIITLAALAVLTLPVAGQGQPMYSGGNRPVTLSSSEPGEAPCFGGTVNAAQDSEDTPEVQVYTGDSILLEPYDAIAPGQQVWVCEMSEEMVGIVYSRDAGEDCEVSEPVEEPRAYVAPCNWGWVRAERVDFNLG